MKCILQQTNLPLQDWQAAAQELQFKAQFEHDENHRRVELPLQRDDSAMGGRHFPAAPMLPLPDNYPPPPAVPSDVSPTADHV